MKFFKFLLGLVLFVSFSYADGRSLAKQLGLDPSSKAIKQWERVFKKKRKMKRYGIDKLTLAEQKELEQYLINHAADSDQPEAAGL